MARSALGTDILEADASNIWIAEGVEVTTDLDDPVAMASGRMPLADDPYEDWAIDVREDLRRRHLTTLLERARFSMARTDWEAVATADPTSEEAFLAVASAAAKDGDRDAVVAAFERHQRSLQDLDLEARPEVRRKLDALLERTEHATSAPIRQREAPELYGRDQTIEAIAIQLVGDDPDGRGRSRRGTQVVTGGAGIGKSTVMLGAAAVLQNDGWRVGRGTATPDDHLSPMAALRAALRGLGAGTPDPLSRRLSDEDMATSPVDHTDLSLVADQIDAWIADLSEPVLLMIDDLQWADPALQRLMVRLASRPDRCWALLLAARSDEPDHPVPDLPSHVPHLDLPPLDDDAAAEVVSTVLSQPDEGWMQEIVARGAGNPFFLLELARETSPAAGSDTLSGKPVAGRGVLTHRGAGGVPTRVVKLLRRRLEPVSPAARRVLEHLAILGSGASLEVLTCMGVALGTDGELLDELSDAWLIRDVEDRLELAHPLLRDAVLAETNVLRRATVHSRVARTLELMAERGDRDRDHHVLAAAAHRIEAFRLGGPALEEALPTVRTAFGAGHLANRLFAPEVAEELYEGGLAAFESMDGASRAALAGNSCDVWRELGHIRLARGDAEAAADAYDHAFGLAPTPMARASCWRARGWIPYRRGDMEAAAGIYQEGLASLPEGDLSAALLDVELGWAWHRSGQLERAVPVLRKASEIAEESGHWRLAARALDRYGVALGAVGRKEEALLVLERAAHAAERAAANRLKSAIALHSAAFLAKLERSREALDRVTEGTALSERIGDPYLRSVAHWITAEVYHEAGHVPEALAQRDAEIGLLVAMDNPLNLAGAYAHRSVLLSELGRDAEAAQAAEAAVSTAQRCGNPRAVATVRERVGPLVKQ